MLFHDDIKTHCFQRIFTSPNLCHPTCWSVSPPAAYYSVNSQCKTHYIYVDFFPAPVCFNPCLWADDTRIAGQRNLFRRSYIPYHIVLKDYKQRDPWLETPHSAPDPAPPPVRRQLPPPPAPTRLPLTPLHRPAPPHRPPRPPPGLARRIRICHHSRPTPRPPQS